MSEVENSGDLQFFSINGPGKQIGAPNDDSVDPDSWDDPSKLRHQVYKIVCFSAVHAVHLVDLFRT